MEKIQHRFGNVKLQYESAIFDARCIVLCTEKPDIELAQGMTFLQDSDDGQSPCFVEFMYDFMSSLFVILEKTRIEKGNEKLEKMELPTAPIEQEQVITDSDTRYEFIFLVKNHFVFSINKYEKHFKKCHNHFIFIFGCFNMFLLVYSVTQ